MPDRRQRLTVGQAIAGVVALYFGVAGLILLDELVFGTFYLSSHSPDWVMRILQVVYSPIIWFIHKL